MPSKTFEHLPEEKKQRIYNALYEELLRVPFPELSINQVIKNAGIPRGSFYQYFENKEDAFDFFVNISFKKTREGIYEKFSAIPGDIFDKSGAIFKEITATMEEKFNAQIIRHIMPYTDFKKLDLFSINASKMKSENLLLEFGTFGIANLDIKSEEDLIDILGIIEALSQSAVTSVLLGVETAEEATEKFIRKLKIVKKATAVNYNFVD